MNKQQNIPKISQARILSHLEGLALFIGAIILYAQHNGDWGFFLLLLFVPDLLALGYLINPVTGTTLYNIGHSYILPMILALVAATSGWALGLSLALIWLAHIGMDRAFGYGFKYADQLKRTHLSRI